VNEARGAAPAGAPARSPRKPAKFDPRDYRDPIPNAALIRTLGPINHAALVLMLKLRAIDLPAADLARLSAAIRPGTAAFLGPNHPEFLTDWLIDKELSVRTSPLMAHWASYEIVNASPAAQWFWLRNNLIANAPGGNGKEYSIRWALQGQGVLLHPEGQATWQSYRVGPLLPGIVDMAWDASRRVLEAGVEKPVWIVPVIWKLHFTGDVGDGLRREMAHIEQTLELPLGNALPVEQRFAALQRGLLVRQWTKLALGGAAPDPGGSGYFAAQAEAITAIRRELELRHGALDPDVGRLQHAVRRKLRDLDESDPEGVRRDRARLYELTRLSGFAPELYDRATLAQEEIAETLKRTRATLMLRGRRDSLHNLIPIAAGPRLVHIRVPEPLAADSSSGDDEPRRDAALAELHSRMQSTLDRTCAEIEPIVARYRRTNPLWSNSSAG
jgi:hypothetical protein